MIAIYLWLNAVLYLLFAVICLLRPTKSAAFSGLGFLSSSGRAEYFAVYVGLEVSWALLFAFCAIRPGWQHAGILYSAFLYGGVIAGRWISIFQKKPQSRNTYLIAGAELLLGIWAFLLL